MEKEIKKVIEESQRDRMTSWELAVLLKKIVDSDKNKNKKEVLHSLAMKVGKTKSYLQGLLDILNQSEEIKKAIEEKKIPYTMIQELDQIPKEYRKKMEKKILSGEIKKRDGLRAIKVVIRMNPDKIEEIVNQNYSECISIDDIRDKALESIKVNERC